MTAPAEQDTLRVFDDLLADQSFWSAFRVDVAEAVTPLFLSIFAAGWHAGMELTAAKGKALPDILGVSPDDMLNPDFISEYAEMAILDYVPEFVNSFSKTTYDTVRGAVSKARLNGTGVESVIRTLTPLFGPQRAELVGVTETTRLFGLGSQASYKAQGINGWKWMAVNDPWVDAICAGLMADSESNPFPIDKLFIPAHPRCRCFPAPALIDEPKVPKKPEDMVFPPEGFKNMQDLASWADRRFPHMKIDLHSESQAGGLAALNASVRKLDELGRKYPEAIKHMTDLRLTPLADNVYAQVVGGRMMELNTKFFNDSVKFSQGIKGDATPSIVQKYSRKTATYSPVKQTPFHPIGTGSPQGVVAHEFGHVMDHYLATRTGSYTMYMRADGGGQASDFHKRMYMQVLDPNVNPSVKKLSGYAVQGGFNEAFAEAFSQANSGIARSRWNATTKRLDQYLTAVVDAPTYHRPLFVSDLSTYELRRSVSEEIAAAYHRAGLDYEGFPKGSAENPFVINTGKK